MADLKELNFNFILKDLSGKDIENTNASKVLANLLASDTGKNPIKFFSWGQILYMCEALKIDGQDLDLLKQTVIDTTSLPALTKAQILEVINKPDPIKLFEPTK